MKIYILHNCHENLFQECQWQHHKKPYHLNVYAQELDIAYIQATEQPVNIVYGCKGAWTGFRQFIIPSLSLKIPCSFKTSAVTVKVKYKLVIYISNTLHKNFLQNFFLHILKQSIRLNSFITLHTCIVFITQSTSQQEGLLKLFFKNQLDCQWKRYVKGI